MGVYQDDVAVIVIMRWTVDGGYQILSRPETALPDPSTWYIPCKYLHDSTSSMSIHVSYHTTWTSEHAPNTAMEHAFQCLMH